MSRTIKNKIAKTAKARDQVSDGELARRLLDTVPGVMRLIRSQYRLAQSHELTMPQFRLLAKLRRKPRSTAELAERMGVSLPAISRMVGILVRRELVTRSPSLTDGRSVSIECTEKGLEAFMAMRRQAQLKLAALCTEFSRGDREDLIAGLAVLEKLPSTD